MTHKKLKVGIIFGGRSGEHEVSLRSAESVMRALDREKYDVVPIGITKRGRWISGPQAWRALADGQTEDAQPVALLPDPTASGLQPLDSAADAAAVPVDIDVFFPVLHGTYGEDGTLQGLLELANVPYVGAGVVGSAVGMDKGMFKQVMTASGIPVLPWRLVLAHQLQTEGTAVIAALEAALDYPMFTKPANLGSSVGISKCTTRAELEAGLAQAAQYDRRIVVEQGVNIRELEISVLGNERPIASVVGEIRPRRDFYDYAAKYLTDDSELLIPAPLTEAQAEEIRTLAVAAYRAIDCSGLGRVDLLLDKESGTIYINEINTIPGFTSISMYPKLWEASGISYAELLDKLIDLACERHQAKAGLTTTFDVAQALAAKTAPNATS